MKIERIEERLAEERAALVLLQLRERAVHKRIDELTENLKAQCNHEGFIEKKSDYYGGSYHDMACTTYWNECTRCGTRSDPWEKSHGYYG